MPEYSNMVKWWVLNASRSNVKSREEWLSSMMKVFESSQEVYTRGVYFKYLQLGLTVDNVENIVAVQSF